MTVINAFHPMYAKTYERKFLDAMKELNRHKLSSSSMSEYVDEVRETNPTHGTIHHILKPLHVSRPPKKMGPRVKERNMTMAEVMDDLAEAKQKKLSTKQRVDLAPKEFKIFSRAGTANVTPKGKKK